MIHQFPKNQKRLRSTAATQRRAENINRLAQELKVRSMTSQEMAVFVNFSSQSGIRKYITDLRSAEIIEIEKYLNPTSLFLGTPVYKLVATDERLEAFLNFVNPGHSNGAAGSEAVERDPKAPKNLPKEPGRSFHVMADDTHFSIRVSRFTPLRDPLHCLLFGSVTGPAPSLSLNSKED